MANKTLQVRKIVIEEKRILLFGDDPRYHVITKCDEPVLLGDTIEYEPYGFNFGWFVKKVD